MDNVLAFIVCFFASFYDNEPMGRALKDVVNLAMSESVKRLTLEIRHLRGIAYDAMTPIDKALEAKNKADKLKKSLPSFLTNVLCKFGKCRKDIVSFLPFIGYDVDHIPEERVVQLMQELIQNEHVVIAEPSSSREGVHFMILMDAALWLNEHWDGKDMKPYEFVWNQATDYVERTFCIDVDEKCKNPEHIFGICYDELIHYKENPVALHIDTSKYVEPTVRVLPSNPGSTIMQSDDTETQVRDLSAIIVNRGIDITTDYQNWLNLGFALADGMGENGRSIYHDLSRMNSGYNSADCDKQYSACLHSHGSGVTIKTFFQMAKDAGIDLSEFARERLASSKVSATSANPPSANSSEKVVKSTVFGVLDSGMADGGMAEVAENASSEVNGYTFSDKLNIEDMVELTRTIIDLHGKETAKCDAQLIGALNAVGGMMGGANGTPEQRSGIYGIYDGHRVFAPTYNIIFSSAGNSKSNLKYCRILVYPVKSEMRRKYEAEKIEYETAMADWEAKSKKERGAAPKEPLFLDPFVPGNSSSSAVYRAIEANGGWGMMFDTEADTISNMLNSDFGNYSDLMRKAHHHEPLTMNRVTEKIHIDIEEPRLSILLTCTPDQLPPLFPSFENGLGSRFLFYYSPDEHVDFHDVFAMEGTPLEDIYKKLGEDLLPLYHAMQMRAGHPIQFVMSKSQQRDFLETYSEILHEQFKMLGKGIRAFIFRIALECFRYAMILTTLRRLSEWQESFDASNPEQKGIFSDDENALVCDDRDFHTAMTIIGCLINHTARVYAVLSKEEDNPFARKGIKLTAEETKIYNSLPEGNFRTAEFLEMTSALNITERTAQRMLSKMCHEMGIIKPVSRGVYNKPHTNKE